MFERFTDRARRIVVLAQEEARELNHNYIGTEHLLLGIIRDGDGVAATALTQLGESLDVVRQRVTEIVGEGPASSMGHIPFTPRAKKVLELALREALQLSHQYVDSEHILLGLIREGEGVAAQVLQSGGLSLQDVRQQVIRILAGYRNAESELAEEREVVEGDLGAAVGWVAYGPDPSDPLAGARPSVGPGPRCPSCSGDFERTLGLRTLTARSKPGGGSRDVIVAYCLTCGTVVAGRIDDAREPEPETAE